MKKYRQVRRLWELYGGENESFDKFIFHLENEGAITFKEWKKLRKIFIREEC